MSKKLWLALALAAAGVCTGTVVAGARLVLKSGIIRDNDRDYNFDPERDSPSSFSPSGTSPFRIAAREGNIWWNSQDLMRFSVASEDGLRLVGNLLEAKKPTNKLAFVVHGHKCVSGEMGFISRMYHDMGYNVFAPDHRAHGKSEGKYLGMGFFEKRDMIIWLKMLCGMFPKCQIVMHGISMGASAVVMTSAEPDLPSNVKCAVEDCGFCDARTSFVYHMERHMPFLPFKNRIISVADRMCSLEANYRFDDASAINAIPESRVPMLFVHGTTDDVVPFWMHKMLYNAHPGDKESLVVEGGRHGICYFKDPACYSGAVDKFSKRFF